MLTERWFREAISSLQRMRDEVNAEITRLTEERDAERLRADLAEMKLQGQAAPVPNVETRGVLRGVYGEGA
jgi:hypothetical protein